MQPDRWERIKDVYHAALECPPGQRPAFLEDACRGDPEALNEVRSLLAQTREDSFLEHPAWRADEPEDDAAAATRDGGLPGRRRSFLWVVGAALVGLTVAFGYAAWHVTRPGANLTYEILNYFYSLTWCAIGVFIGFARPEVGMARLAFGAATLTGLAFLSAVEIPGLYALQPLHVVLGYHFFYLFPGDRPKARTWRALLWLLYAAAAIVVARVLVAKWLWFAGGAQRDSRVLAGHAFTPTRALALTTALSAIIGAIVLAAIKYRATTDADKRRRFHWVALGGIVGLVPALLAIVFADLRAMPAFAGWLFPGRSWRYFDLASTACSLAIPVSVAYVVVKHGVWGVHVAIRRALQYVFARRSLEVLLTLPTAALLVAVVRGRHKTIVELVVGNWNAVGWIAALGLSLRLRTPILRWVDRRFLHEAYDGERLVLDLVDRLKQFDSAEQMGGFLCDELARSLHPKAMHLWWRKSGVMTLATSSDPALTAGALPVSEDLLERLMRRGKTAPVPLPTGSAASAGDARWLSERGVRLIVPVSGAARVDVVLMLGEKESEEPYTPGDAHIVHAMVQAAALMLDNLRLKAQVIDEQRVRREVLAKLDRGLVTLLKECPACGACYDSGTEECGRDGAELTLTLPVARVIDGKYRLERVIGRGGMGAVYEARDLRLNRDVAIKVMIAGAFGHESALRRFRREAQALARLTHPNVVAVHDFGELEGGGAYLVMERLRGATLRAEIGRVGAFAAREAAAWFRPMLDGLSAAHECGIVHRDLKPENVVGVWRPDGALVVKILDFGLAKVRPRESHLSADALTESGVVVGTLAYMAPEQLGGREVDASADVYSAGVILAEMLTGARPSGADAQTRGEYRLPTEVANREALDAVLQRCLAPLPSRRFPSAVELRAALGPALG